MSGFSTFWQRLFGRKPPPHSSTVVFDEVGVTRTRPDGQTESVTWDDLQEVTIWTSDTGPLADDVLWILSGTECGCLVPSEAVGMSALLERIQQLPGFDNEAVIRAMGSTSFARFTCWQRPVSPSV